MHGGYQNPMMQRNYVGENLGYRTLPVRKSNYISDNYGYERPITPDITRGLPNNKFKSNTIGYSNVNYRNYDVKHNELPPRQYPIHQLGIPVQLPQVADFTVNQNSQVPCNVQYQNYMPQSPRYTHSQTPPKYNNAQPALSSYANSNKLQSSQTDESLKISPIDPRSSGGFQSSTPSSDLKSAVNLESRLLSPKKASMSSEELYAVIHKGKKKLNIEPPKQSPNSPAKQVMLTEGSTKVKSPETGRIGDKARSRFSWSPSDGEYVDYNTNIDKISPPNKEIGSRLSWACSDRKGNQQTSRLDFKRLLLQQSAKSNIISPSNKKVSAVEQLKLSKQKAQRSSQTKDHEMNILELSRSPRNLQTRKLLPATPSSPKEVADKARPMPKLMSPKSQWRFASPRSDVLSSTILEDCREDEISPNTSAESKKSEQGSPLTTKGEGKSKQDSFRKELFSSSPNKARSVAEYLRAQRAHFFSSKPVNSNEPNTTVQKSQSPSSALETAF